MPELWRGIVSRLERCFRLEGKLSGGGEFGMNQARPKKLMQRRLCLRAEAALTIGLWRTKAASISGAILLGFY